MKILIPRREAVKPACHAEHGYVTLQRAAEWASVSEKTLKRWVGRGLPIYQAGPRERVLLKPEDIDRFLTCKRTQPIDLHQLVDEVMADLNRKKAD